MPAAAAMAAQLLAFQAPMIVMYSPINPLVPGNPTEASMKHHEDQRIVRHQGGEAAIADNLARVQPVVDHADAEEQGCRDDTVRQHLDHAAGDRQHC